MVAKTRARRKKFLSNFDRLMKLEYCYSVFSKNFLNSNLIEVKCEIPCDSFRFGVKNSNFQPKFNFYQSK